MWWVPIEFAAHMPIICQVFAKVLWGVVRALLECVPGLLWFLEWNEQ